jgi:GNAT superfamily N-acetyltransferase
MDIRRSALKGSPHITRPAVLRLAVPEDIVSILDTLRTALEEVRQDVAIPEPELPYAMQAMLDLIAQGFVHVLVNTNGKVVGLIALSLRVWPWVSPSNPAGRYLVDEYFWVERAYRRHGKAAQLIEAAKATADTLGLPLMIEMSSGGADASLKDRFIRRCGFTHIGGKMFRAPRDSMPRRV